MLPPVTETVLVPDRPVATAAIVFDAISMALEETVVLAVTLMVDTSISEIRAPLPTCEETKPTDAAFSAPAVLLIVFVPLRPVAVPETVFEATDKSEPAVAAFTVIVIFASVASSAVTAPPLA
jgi:hypothetical protein